MINGNCMKVTVFNNYLKFLNACYNTDEKYLIVSSEFCQFISENKNLNIHDFDLSKIEKKCIIIPRNIKFDWIVYCCVIDGEIKRLHKFSTMENQKRGKDDDFLKLFCSITKVDWTIRKIN